MKYLAAGIKLLKIADEANVGDEENFILKLNSGIDSLKRDRDKIRGVLVKKPPTASLLPIRHKAKRNTLLAGVVGLLFMVLLTFFIEYIRNALKHTRKAL